LNLHMLHAQRRGFFKRSYELTERGSRLTDIADIKREGCAFTVDAHSYRISRERSKRFLLDGPGGQAAVAERDGGRRWRISSPAGSFELVRPSMWRSAWELHANGQPVGTIEHDGGFGRSSKAELPAELPRALRVFVFYVVLMVWERAANAAAAG
jgi:hypothetical protein